MSSNPVRPNIFTIIYDQHSPFVCSWWKDLVQVLKTCAKKCHMAISSWRLEHLGLETLYDMFIITAVRCNKNLITEVLDYSFKIFETSKHITTKDRQRSTPDSLPGGVFSRWKIRGGSPKMLGSSKLWIAFSAYAPDDQRMTSGKLIEVVLQQFIGRIPLFCWSLR